MDSFFGIGLPEFVLILIIAGMIMGPERIATTARWLGKTTAQLQAISRGFVRQLTNELNSAGDGEAIKDAMAEMQELRRQVSELRTELTNPVKGAFSEGNKAMQESKELANRSIKPPILKPTVDNGRKAVEHEAPVGQLTLPAPLDIPDDPEI